ncbi:ABC transporter permease [Actinoplanes sp. NPDC051513]|uniref:ABC transporter permease n=1 Tax=Actinoplanes sp. NPDC051513 TaxID=3363908 RepID=UPI0037B5B210
MNTDSTSTAAPTAGAPAPQAPVGSGRPGRKTRALRRVLRAPAASVVLATVLLVGIIGAVHPTFLKPNQLLDILQASTYVGLLAVGMSYLVAMREIDLSVGSQFGLCLIATGLLISHGVNAWMAGGIGIVAGALLGLVNATVVTFIRIPTIVATLATLSVFRGLAIALTGGQQVVGLPVEDSFFTVLGGEIGGVPISVIVLVAVALVLGLVLHHTPFGYRVLAVGSNPEAAAFAGISVARVRMQVLVLVGVLAGIGGCLGLAYFTSGDPTIGTGFELQAIAAAVIGGTPLRGGTATVIGAVCGAVLLNVVAAGLTYFSIPANWSAFATGLVILVAVGIDSLVRRRREAGQPALQPSLTEQ